MAESRHRHPKSKSLRTIRDDKKIKTRSKDRHNPLDSRTPPLLTKKHTSIEEVRKREVLREKNLQINNINKQRKIDSNSKSCTQPKRYKIDSEIDVNMNKPKLSTCDLIDKEKYLKQIDSEDEDNIIEQRREKRKRLLGKYGNLQNQQIFKVKVSRSNNTSNKIGTNDTLDNVGNNKRKLDIKNVITDMFSEIEDFSEINVSYKDSQDKLDNSQCDDPEGYYNARMGDVIHNNQYHFKNILGRGVFANVVSAHDNCNNAEVAIKIIRNKDIMFKTGLKEINILKTIKSIDPEDKYHCVKFISHFIYKQHLCIVLEPLSIDMRCFINKCGGHGINIKAVMSFSRQLLLALKLLKNVGVIHADIKPDNILVNENKNILKLCDFGSAAKVGESRQTRYLVSRFYRAPEIILGIPYAHGVDMWSAACTIFEMATGKILFTGSSNNKMLKSFMDIKGQFSDKLIRKGKFKDQHFNCNNNFLMHVEDEHTKRVKLVEMCKMTPTRDMLKELNKYCKNVREQDKNKQLKHLLEKMIALDSNHRPSIEDCLKHVFIRQACDKYKI